MASKIGCTSGAIFGDDDYLTLDKLLVSLSTEAAHEDGSFTICLWIYLLKSSKAGIVIRQVLLDSKTAMPFLTLDNDRKLTLFPALFLSDNKLVLEDDAVSIDKCSVTAELACPLEKWVHVGCEVSYLCFFMA